MSDSDIIRVEYEALKRFCGGDRKLILEVIEKLGPFLRDYFRRRSPDIVTSEELCAVLEEATAGWAVPLNPLDLN